jgi:alkylated DNA repair dioxygenase AlkB
VVAARSLQRKARVAGRWLRQADVALPTVLSQRSLFSPVVPTFDAEFRRLERIDLGAGAWVDVQQQWVGAHERLFEALYETTAWQSHTRDMYERHVAVPRLTAVVPPGGAAPLALLEMSEALSARYGRPLSQLSLACYRDGRDSVAPHGDTIGIEADDAVVAIVSLGGSRRFTMRRVLRIGESGLRPEGRFWTGADSLAFNVGQGDLVVMGGTCQRTWLHGIPKVARAAPRIAVMFR